MGFLDSIFKSVKREVERDVTRNAADAVASSISNVFNKKVNESAGNTNTGSPSAPSNDRYQGYVIPNNTQNGGYKPSEPVYEEGGPIIIDGIDYARIYNCDVKHFRDILKESFPEMTLTEDVPVKDIIPGLNGAYQSVEFLLSDGTTPKVAIQLRRPSQATKVGTQRQFQQHGIGYISLWRDYKNQKEYIEKRVKDALWN